MSAKTLVLDMKMSEAFSWSDSDVVVRDALWNHFMTENNRDTVATVKAVKPYTEMPDDQVAAAVEKILH